MAIMWAESLSKWEQAADARYREEGRRSCEHIWEKVDHEVWQCEACAEFRYQREWWREE